MSKEKHAAVAYVGRLHDARRSVRFVANREQWYQQQREKCAKTWNDLLAAGMKVSVPEPYVNNAWRSLLVGTYMIYAGDQLNYSAGNQYARKYAHESGESMRSLLLWGHERDAAEAIRPIFDVSAAEYRVPRWGVQARRAGRVLLCHAGRGAGAQDREPLWQREIDMIVKSRDPRPDCCRAKSIAATLKRRSFQLTPTRIAGADCAIWRWCWKTMGDTGTGGKATQSRRRLSQSHSPAIDTAMDRSVDPPFLPIALGEETVHDPITSTRLGSYWNLVMPQVLFSGVFTAKSQTASDILRYVQTRGGLCMGMIRCQSAAAPG